MEKTHVDGRWFLTSPAAAVLQYAQIAGRVAREELQLALDKMLAKNPIMNSRVELDARREAWFVPRSDGIYVEAITREDDDHWRRVAEQEQVRGFDPAAGPLMRVILLRGDDRSDLFLVVHHCICDGFSMLILMNDLLEFLADPDKPVIPSPVMALTKPEGGPASKAGNKMAKAMDRFNRYWGKHEVLFELEQIPELQAAYNKNHEPCCTYAYIGCEEVQRLQAAFREQGIHFSSALCAAFYLAQHKVQGDFKGSGAVNLAVRVKPSWLLEIDPETMGVTTGAALNLEPPRDTKDDLLRIIAAWDGAAAALRAETDFSDLAAASSPSPAFIDALPYILFAGYGSRARDKCVRLMNSEEDHFALNIVNMGKTNLPLALGDYRFTRHICIVPKHVQSQKAVGISSFDGGMDITMGSDAHVVPRSRARAIVDAAVDILTRMG
jgi:hypothetical protein